ncbi:hypothetical protein PIB30_034643 [Stylosanthes scabra]|uniref:Uncharacterized protein n=1 Tax=Stylosanthes scabra TaxID=79078 RepID=A0ABU6YBQ6_9FABA|nr:hypothetical protein [Stylosanthes scabra]
MKLENVVASSGESNPNPTSVHIGGSLYLAPVAPVESIIPPCVKSLPSLLTYNAKYYARCKNFGSGCEWLIRVAMCTRKGFWEVRREIRIQTELSEDMDGKIEDCCCDLIYGDWEKS